MKVHTTAFKEQIKEMGRELDSIITYGDTVLGNEQLNAVTPSFQGSLLKSVMKQLDIDSNVEIPLGTILNYQFGVKVNGEYEYLNFGNYIVKDVEKQEDTMSYKITCYDKMLYSMKNYEKMNITYPITIRSYINALCSFLGITFANNNDTFVNYNKTIPNELYLDASGNSIGYTFRDVLDELAQVTASTICLNDNDELEIRYINDTGDTIDEEFLKNVNVNFGERYGKVNSIVLSRSGESDNVYLRDEASVSTNGLTELKIVDNQIMNFNNRDEFLPEILGKLNGLEYYLNDFASTGIAYYDVCDRYGVKVGDTTYSCVMFNDEILVTQGLQENVFTEMPEETQTDYTKADKTDRKINQTYLIVDKQNQQIEAVVSQTNEQNQKIAKVTQTVDELNSKISDIADITISGEDTDAQVELDNINQSEPIRLVIRPIGESISYDYPHEDYPHEDFSKIRTVRFTNTKTDEVVDYVLPMDLLYYDSENYDEFILDYEGQTCMVNKRVGYNADGTTYVLDSEQIIECDEYPRILLTEGDYKVEVLGYDTAYIFVRLMAQNIYTTQFYTKAETDSIINQTSQSIDLSVNKKLSNYSTTIEMNSAIQLSASSIKNEVNATIDGVEENINAQLELKVDTENLVSEINASADVINLRGNRVIIDSDNFKLTADGTITANAGTFGGTINTNKDLTVGNNVYIGQNQSSNVINEKYLRFTDNIYFKRISVGSGAEALSIYSPMFGINSGSSSFSINDGGYAQTQAQYITLNAGEYVTLSTDGSWLDVSNEQITVNRNITNISDERLKQKIKDMDVSWVDELRLKEFEYKSTPNKKQIGLIAQDYLDKDYSKYFIEKIKIPNDEQEYYGISYGNITNALIQYCQELKQEINTLKNEINSLKESEK